NTQTANSTGTARRISGRIDSCGSRAKPAAECAETYGCADGWSVRTAARCEKPADNGRGIRGWRTDCVRGRDKNGRAGQVPSRIRRCGEEYDFGSAGIRRCADRLRQRWMAGHLFVEWVDLRCAERKRKAAAGDAAAQQSRWNVCRCNGESRSGERAVGIRRRGCGLRQRWMAGYLRFEFWEELAVSQ